ncbi:MAG: hypothetical protein JST70_11920 [Bacteroidetes bacterium]|nr:hypothetical protein [Bacteroidota bacterium]
MYAIKEKMEDIYNTLIKNKKLSALGLLTGKCGEMLFIQKYSEFINIDISAYLEETIEDLCINFNTSWHPSFSNGKAGVNYYFSNLFKNGMLSKYDYDMLSSDDSHLKHISLTLLKNGNYDFLHGSLGIAYYILHSTVPTDFIYFNQLFKELSEITTTDTNFLFHNYDHINQVVEKNKINLGLAHGLPSILKFCLSCYKFKVCENHAKLISNIIIKFMLNVASNPIDNCAFPSIYVKDEPLQVSKRLAWCYGDLGIGLILYQAAITLEDNELLLFASNLLIQSTQRTKVEDTLIYDGGICHGSAGAAHIYNKMWNYTGETEYKLASAFWIKKTLEFAKYQDGLAGFKKYNSMLKIHQNDFGILEGIAGIGLVLYSYITNDFSWDYCLMIND